MERGPGTDLASAETFSWRDTRVLSRMGQAGVGRVVEAQPPRDFDFSESYKEGSEP